jgi:hypothetical protein
MIPREEGEGLLSYLDRLTMMADERASLQVRFEALGQELATATEADQQLARYSALIEADQNKDSMSGIEVTKLLTDSASDTAFPLMQFANSKINGGANSETNDLLAQGQDLVAQEEAPSSTLENAPAISPVEPANSEINSETTGQEEEFVSGFDRTHAWVLTQPGEFAVTDASFELDIPEKSAAKYLAQLMKQEVISRIAGTGLFRVPSRYRVITEVEEAPAEVDEPVHLDRSRLPLDQRLLMEHLEKNGPMSQKLACAQLNWVNSRADRAIGALLEGGLVGRRGPTLIAIPEELRGAAD